jgi:hypothetical protein
VGHPYRHARQDGPVPGKRINSLIAIGMVVRQGFQSQGLLALADQVTWRLGGEQDEDDLENGWDRLQ